MRARLLAPPNPWVGCVIVHNGRIVGSGHTQVVGGPHAEVVALTAAGESARGADLYVTLEPCCHTGRTGPCTEKIIAAGIRRVFYGADDPDVRVAGKGLARLKTAGIEVYQADKDGCEADLAPYIHQRRTGLPYVVCKIASTIDGKTAASDGSSMWITGEVARRDAHNLRAESCAILCGTQTALKDQPQLTVRGIDIPRHRLRVLLDRQGLVHSGPLLDQSLAPTLAFSRVPHSCETIQVAETASGYDLHAVLAELGRRGILQVLVEGGSTVTSSFLREDLCQKLVVYVGAALLGEGLASVQPLGIHTIEQAKRLKLLQAQVLGDDVRLDYAPLGCSH